MLPTWSRMYQHPDVPSFRGFGNLPSIIDHLRTITTVSENGVQNIQMVYQPNSVPSVRAEVPRNISMTVDRKSLSANLPQEYNNFTSTSLNMLNITREPTVCRPAVRAAGILHENSSTEIIDVNTLAQKNALPVRQIEIADTGSRLYCVEEIVNTTSWLKMIDIAQDVYTCNVILMTTSKGVLLKTIRNIKPGESLQIWFAQDISFMMNIPCLQPFNIRGNKAYMCHTCDEIFEYPNPLKLHIALNCNRLDKSHLWILLAKRFATFNSSRLYMSHNNLHPQTSFTFELTPTTTTQPINALSPILTETSIFSDLSIRNDSPNSLNQLSPPSLSQLSSSSSSTEIISPHSLDHMAPVEEVTSRHSAFRPYVRDGNVHNSRIHVTPYSMHLPATATLKTDALAVDVETIVSNAGKSREGHRCLYCGRLYSRKYGLKIHIRTHTGYKPLKCPFCSRAFGDPSNLNKHIRLHTEGNTPYKCKVCSKVMVRRRDLERHMRSRHQPEHEENA